MSQVQKTTFEFGPWELQGLNIDRENLALVFIRDVTVRTSEGITVLTERRTRGVNGITFDLEGEERLTFEALRTAVLAVGNRLTELATPLVKAPAE